MSSTEKCNCPQVLDLMEEKKLILNDLALASESLRDHEDVFIDQHLNFALRKVDAVIHKIRTGV